MVSGGIKADIDPLHIKKRNMTFGIWLSEKSIKKGIGRQRGGEQLPPPPWRRYHLINY
jgi:hypothetical protein